ncbi:MAG: hypothetical protein ACERKD_22830 [Prolixibacteraceae bacterium]
MKHFILILVIVCSSQFSNAQGVSIGDYQALIAFYESTHGENWNNSRNWLSDKPVNEWYGITVENNRVKEIWMTNNNLKGDFPPELTRLTELRKLDLSYAELGQASIDIIASLTNLEDLELAVCNIYAEFPATFMQLTKLKILDLTNNRFYGTILDKITNAVDLTMLDLSVNQFTGSLPAEISKLSKLTELTLFKNKFKGSLPSSITSLSKLSRLNLGNNQFEGEIPTDINKMSNLQYLYLNNNSFSGSIPGTFHTLTKLIDLGLTFNNFTGNLPNLSALKSLSDFRCNNNYFTFADIDSALVDWTKNWFQYSPQKNIDQPVLLEENGKKYLQVDYEFDANDIFVWNIDGVQHIELFRKKQEITNIEGKIFTCEITNSKYPDLKLRTKAFGNGVTLNHGILEAEYQALLDFAEALDYTNWQNNSNWLSNYEVEGWNGLTVENGHVTRMLLTGNLLKGTFPKAFCNLEELNYAMISHNAISGNLPAELGNMKKLSILDLYGNQLTGEIPKEIGEMEVMKYLTFSANQLTGSIPVELAQLKNLSTFSVENNYLSGSIPERSLFGSNIIMQLKMNYFNFTNLAASKLFFFSATYYSPQREMPAPITMNTNDSSFLMIEDSLLGNLYSWYRHDVLIADSMAHTINTNKFGEGDYSCTWTNPGFKGLILQSGTVNISCLPPSELIFENTSSHSSSVKWNEAISASGWTMVYGLQGFDRETEGQTLKLENMDSLIMDGLEPASTYDVYIKSNCGDNWSAKFSFTTLQSYKLFVEITSGEGEVEPNTGSIDEGASVRFSITPGKDYALDAVSYNDVDVRSDLQDENGSYLFTVEAMEADGHLLVSFAPISSALSLTFRPIDFKYLPQEKQIVFEGDVMNDSKAMVYTIFGQVIISRNVVEKRLSVGELKPGVYLVVINLNRFKLTVQ